MDSTYLHTNGDAGGERKNPYETMSNHVNTNGEQMAITASSMIRSHSIFGDLHGVQLDPIAADILRKELEQEIFARLRITLMEAPSSDEVESYVILQECLEMRKIYVFQDAVAPWEK
ncbi:unnamed protein product [Lathyrus sativus]|nr:unnamed protein product [Lathyrus sativus]